MERDQKAALGKNNDLPLVFRMKTRYEVTIEVTNGLMDKQRIVKCLKGDCFI